MKASLLATINRPRPRHLSPALILPMLVITLVLSILLAVSFGSTAISFSQIIQILLNATGIGHFPHIWDPTVDIIIWQIRLPLVLGAVLVGAALGVAGTLSQGLLRNPLADPYLIGTSSGAALGATIAFILPVDTLASFFFPLTALLAFLGALVTVLFVYAIARSGGKTPVVTLLLAGVVMNAVLWAVQTFLLTIRPPGQGAVFQDLFNWLSGGISVPGWPALGVVAICILISLFLAFAQAHTLDAFALGEESAAFLGINIEHFKFGLIMIVSLLTAAAVSISGLIGFVGLIVPHIMRLLLGPGHRTLILASALSGATFLVLADLLARTVLAPTVLPVGIFTALVGAPFFLFLLRTRKRGKQW